MGLVHSKAAFLGLSAALMIAGVATAQELSELTCRSTTTGATSAVQCDIANGNVLVNTCSCAAGYVLVDRGVRPAAGAPPRPASGG